MDTRCAASAYVVFRTKATAESLKPANVVRYLTSRSYGFAFTPILRFRKSLLKHLYFCSLSSDCLIVYLLSPAGNTNERMHIVVTAIRTYHLPLPPRSL